MAYKFLLFGFNDHEAGGGMDDLLLEFDTFEEFDNEFKFNNYDNYQLVEVDGFTFEEFHSNIIWHVGKDDYKTIKSLREDEFREWIKGKVGRSNQ